MRRNTLLKVVMVTAIVMVVSFAIAGIIGVQAGIFREMGRQPFTRPGITHTVKIQAPSQEIKQVVISDSVSEYVKVYVGTGDTITARFREPEKVNTPIGEPRFEGQFTAGTAEIRLEWKRQASACGVIKGSWLEVMLPQGYEKALSVKTVSGDIAPAGQAFSDVTISTVSGDLKADGLLAKQFTFHTTSGDINVNTLQSEQAKITVVSGDVAIKQMTGDADIHSTSGDVAITFTKAPRKVTAESVSGELDLALAQGSGVTLDTHAVSGDVRLTLPKDAGFALNARSVSGDIACDFPITLSSSHKGPGEDRIVGTVGNGKGSVSARTVSGDIDILSGASTP